MNKIVVVFFFLFYQGAGAQVNIDSLFQIWNDKSADDTTRLIALNHAISNGLLFNHPDTAFILSEQLYEFAKSKGQYKYMGLARNNQAFSYFIRSKHFYALDYYQQCLKINTEHNDQFGISGALNGIGIIYSNLGNYQEGLVYYNRIMRLNESSFNPRVAAGTTINMAVCYYELGELDEALVTSTRGLELADSIGETRFLANGLDLRGKILQAMVQRERAKSDFERSLQLFQEMGDHAGYAEAAANFGSLYLDMGSYSQAIKLCEESLGLSESLESLELQKNAYSTLYHSYKALGNGEKALFYHEKMLLAQEGLMKEAASRSLQQMEFEKVVFQDSIAKAEETRLVEEAHRKQLHAEEKTRNISLGIGGMVLLLAGGLYSRLRYIRKSKADLQIEKDRSENLLLNILPAEIAEELKKTGKAEARDFDKVSILFTDFVGFTEQSAKLTAAELVAEINLCFEAFDGILEKYQVEKIKTIGDAYMAAGGLPVPSPDSVKNTVFAALDMQAFIQSRKANNEVLGKPAFDMRAGIHTGPVVAGIVGVKKFQYDIWGDTVNTASRMESSGRVGKVNISQTTYELLKEESQFSFENRGKIEAKGKGEIEMYFVSLT